MTQHTSRRIRYPHHWPVQIPQLPATRQQHPQAAATAEVLPAATESLDTQDAFGGELVTAPWMGLHYVHEAP
ncbi:hypothetical protein [Arthrobacter globiformis]|uniref:hypothetical protein n=1 Tax=Arthrobacter globiformis TaxID=1665 RepID=UPI002791BB69|nr:hypothetical protein [Arthrobacter globiformis]MDQ0619094.1 hypothetical protein [Arthrobacter globiformis]